MEVITSNKGGQNIILNGYMYRRRLRDKQVSGRVASAHGQVGVNLQRVPPCCISPRSGCSQPAAGAAMLHQPTVRLESTCSGCRHVASAHGQVGVNLQRVPPCCISPRSGWSQPAAGAAMFSLNDIVYECIVLRCIVETKLTYLITYNNN